MARVVAERRLATGHAVSLVHGDLTEEALDVIVNAANERLQLGGGVAGAIRRRGGPTIQAECDAWVRAHGLAGHDRPALTSGGALPCRAIVHAVGPVWGSGDEDRKLAAAYRSALELAHARGYGSIALPSLSTGIFGFPVERAAPIALRAVGEFCEAHRDSPVREIRFTVIDAPTLAAFHTAFTSAFGGA
jgi:O-acetyl-ADP-ribose deacetylase (regulator of RNase III)